MSAAPTIAAMPVMRPLLDHQQIAHLALSIPEERGAFLVNLDEVSQLGLILANTKIEEGTGYSMKAQPMDLFDDLSVYEEREPQDVRPPKTVVSAAKREKTVISAAKVQKAVVSSAAAPQRVKPDRKGGELAKKIDGMNQKSEKADNKIFGQVEDDDL